MLSDSHRLLLKACQLYYLDRLTQAEIAARLHISRQKVQRLLDRAQNEGVVQITIRPLMGIYTDLERALEQRYELREAVVVETSAYADHTIVAREVGAGAAEYVQRVVSPDERIVLSWGSTLLGLVNALAGSPDKKELPGVSVMQGLGGLVDPNNDVHAADLTRRLARAFGGTGYLLPAPGVAGSKRARNVLLQDPHVGEALDRARRATLALMGIGAPRPEALLVKQGTIVQWKELAAIKKQGAVGDLNLRYFGANGEPVLSELDDRVIGLTLQEIQATGHVVGMAGGAEKLDAIRGALAGKWIHVLVTDHITAAALLQPKEESHERKNHRRSRDVGHQGT